MAELDAIEPARLREIARLAIEEHLPPDHFKVLKAAEESEREIDLRRVGGFAW